MRQPVYIKIAIDTAELVAPFQGLFVWIPRGYIWDGMTMAKVAGIEKFGDLVDSASVEHDYIYAHEGRFGDIFITRKQADMILEYQLVQSGVPRIHAAYIYYLVRAFGWILWRRRT